MIRILTDSSSGFTLSDIKEINVEMVHMPISINGKEYIDQLNLSHEEFFKKFNSKTLPKTSAVNQATFEEIFEDVKKKGDEMIVLLISKELSITHEQALMAKQAVDYDKIYVVNTLATVSTLIALVMEAVKMRDIKMPVAKIVTELEKLAQKVKLFAYVDTLKYLRAGGRISATAAVVGTMLGIKPMVAIIEGKVVPHGKSIGTKKAQAMLLSQIGKHSVDFDKPVYFAHVNVKEECEKLKEIAKQAHEFIDGGTWFMSATVATHTGPGAVAVVFFEK